MPFLCSYNKIPALTNILKKCYNKYIVCAQAYVSCNILIICVKTAAPISGGFFFVFAAQPKYAFPSAETISPVSAS